MAAGAASRLRLDDSSSADIGGSNIPFKTSAKYLEVKSEQTVSMQDQISRVCRASFLELRRPDSIQLYLSKSTSARLVAASITSRLDYCNSDLACGTDRSIAEGSGQCSTACSGET